MITPGRIGVVQKRIMLSNGVELLPGQSFFVLAISQKENGLILEVNDTLCFVPNDQINALSFVWVCDILNKSLVFLEVSDIYDRTR